MPSEEGRGVRGEVGGEKVVLVDGEDCREASADGHGGKDGAGLLDGKRVGCREDERDGSECHVEDSPREGYPEREKEDDGFREEEVEGAVDRDGDHFM